MCGTAARVQRKVERRFKRSTKSQSSTGISQTFRLRLPPTLLTRMSRPPRRSTAASISFAAGPSSVRSPATVTATPPAVLMAAAVCSIPAASMSPRATRAPSRARTSAISRPRPLAAPVTTATRFLTPGMRVMLAREAAPLPEWTPRAPRARLWRRRVWIDRATREEPPMTTAADGTKAAFAAEYDVPIPYMQRTRDYYLALGYENPYRWASFTEVPFASLAKPLARARIGLITTAAPYRPEAGDQGPGAPYNAAAINTYLPLGALREAVMAGRIGSLGRRLHGAPTNRSHRATFADAAELLRRCREDAVDAVVLVPS